MSWWNDYVGVPYLDRGRTREGADCWGLVRLVYREQFGAELPTFDGYTDSADPAVDELIARHREGWSPVDEPIEGDVVLFRVLGREAHVGVFIGQGRFLHARQGHAACIERLGSGAWKHRVVGYHRYTPKAGELTLAGCPNPLRTARIEVQFPAGSTIAQVVHWVRKQSPVQAELVLMLDGKVIPAELWDSTTTLPGQRIEYRALPRGDIGRVLLSLAVVAVAVIAAPYIAPTIASTLGVSTAVATTLATAALTFAGTLLVNAIFPVRPPKQNNPGQPERQNLLQGGSNQANPYGAVPVVLGRVRYTPPLGAVSYAEALTKTAYLRMLLCWGYGPLQISDMRVGATPVSALEDCELQTLTGYNDGAEATTAFNRLYGQDVSQQYFGVELTSDGTSAGSPWTEHVISDECDRITVTLHFPEGLRRMPVEGSSAGKIDETAFRGQIQVRQLHPVTLAPLTSFGEINALFPGQSINLLPAWFNIDADEELEPVYRWTRLSLDQHSKLIVRHGAFTTNPSGDPSGNLLLRQQQAAFGVGLTYNRLPDYGPSEEGLWDICMYGNDVFTTVDRRDSTITGAALTISGVQAEVASATIQRADVETVRYGLSGQPYYKRKDAFSTSISFNVARGAYEVRVRRTNTSEKEFIYPSGNKGVRYHTCQLLLISGSKNHRPVVRPPGVNLAMTAIRVRATNQINGNLEGISATVTSICKDWDRTASVWVERPTRNPASLLRWVLQHPANAQRVADSQIDLDALVDWHNYCRVNAFMFDAVLSEQQSLLDVLRDIAAAGRASPTLRDGQWTVVIDRPRTAVAQHFTPHNSWGFEGARALPKLPHAFRVQFNNSERGFQADEMIVYNDGYSSANATLFEALQLPGVTTKAAIFKHARFHLAQLKLRPETYTLNADIEHLICQRGDLVRVTHDVPMWGLGTGRIKNRVSATVLELDEQVPMSAGVQYTIRLRLEDGSSITRTVAAVGADGHYSTVTLTTSVTTLQGAPGNLFMFGSLSSESVQLVVQAIEPAENMTARLMLVDYSPAVYDSDTEVVPAFNSQITLPPKLLQTTITQTPTIGQIISDERAMEYLGDGKYAYRIQVAFTNPAGLPSNVSAIEGQIDYASDTVLDWAATRLFRVADRAVVFGDVERGAVYRLRLRYVGDDGRAGPWTAVRTHTVAGKLSAPSAPTGLTYSFADTTLTAATVTLDWADAPEPDVERYEVSRPGRTVYVTASTFTELAAWMGSRTYSVVAIDAAGNRSAAANVTIVKQAPGAPQNLRTDVIDNNVLLYWDAPAVTTLPVDTYELRRGEVWATAQVIGRKSGGFTSVFEFEAGAKTYWVAAIDTDNNMGEPASVGAQVSAPPDFVLHANHSSELDGTLSSAIWEGGHVLLPVNAAETWAQHFTARGWATPQDQIDAGYPLFIQPSAASGYYEESIDYGAVLSSSTVTLSYSGAWIAGSGTRTPRIETSLNGVDWSVNNGVTQVFATNFRYVRVRVTITPATAAGLYRLNSLAVRLDAKLKNDGGTAAVNAADVGGTPVAFNLPFIDVTSITVTAQGTTPLTAIYDFADVPNPTGFAVYLFDSAGNRASGTVSWSVKGY